MMSKASLTPGTATVIHGDALDLPLEANSVDLVVTSPPYFGLRSYQDAGEHYAGQIGSEATPAEFVDALLAATSEMIRVLKPTGSIFVNLGDKYATGSTPGPQSANTTMTGGAHKGVSNVVTRKLKDGVANKSLIGIPWRYALRCIDELGLILRAEIIWSKPNGLPESVTDRVRRSHETWFHFTVQPRYFSAVDDVREPHLTDIKSVSEGHDINHNRNDGGRALNDRPRSPLGKLPSSVWTVATEPLQVPAHLGVDHFAAFPTTWPRRIIQGWSPVGGTVLDPFGGTGTTATVAKALGRHGISVDLSRDYCRIAEWRTTDNKQLAKAAGLDASKVPVQVDGQATLADLWEGGAA